MTQDLEKPKGEVVVFEASIEQPLRDGHRIHAFSSGGGLRVIRIESDSGELVGYGEAPQVEEALTHAALNYQLRETYEQQYSGENARYPNFLTGTPEVSSPLDRHILAGHTFDAHFKDGEVVVMLNGLENAPAIPRAVQDRVVETGEHTTWEERGVTYEVTSTGFGVSMRATEIPEGVDPWMYQYSRVGTGDTFDVAVVDAFEAPIVELMPN